MCAFLRDAVPHPVSSQELEDRQAWSPRPFDEERDRTRCTLTWSSSWCSSLLRSPSRQRSALPGAVLPKTLQRRPTRAARRAGVAAAALHAGKTRRSASMSARTFEPIPSTAVHAAPNAPPTRCAISDDALPAAALGSLRAASRASRHRAIRIIAEAARRPAPIRRSAAVVSVPAAPARRSARVGARSSRRIRRTVAPVARRARARWPSAARAHAPLVARRGSRIARTRASISRATIRAAGRVEPHAPLALSASTESADVRPVSRRATGHAPTRSSIASTAAGAEPNAPTAKYAWKGRASSADVTAKPTRAGRSTVVANAFASRRIRTTAERAVRPVPRSSCAPARNASARRASPRAEVHASISRAIRNIAARARRSATRGRSAAPARAEPLAARERRTAQAPV
jgi:hypothetical protein